jgi:hypothetical protein
VLAEAVERVEQLRQRIRCTDQEPSDLLHAVPARSALPCHHNLPLPRRPWVLPRGPGDPAAARIHPVRQRPVMTKPGVCLAREPIPPTVLTVLIDPELIHANRCMPNPVFICWRKLAY